MFAWLDSRGNAVTGSAGWLHPVWCADAQQAERILDGLAGGVAEGEAGGFDPLPVGVDHLAVAIEGMECRGDLGPADP